MRISDWSSDVCSSDLQGGTAVVAKRLGNVAVTFAEGQVRGAGRGQASAYVDRAAATLPADIQERITRKRKPGDQDAAIDPLSLPEVRAAVQRASFELLVGRSEEHTSELESLMRTSYAVLCLKKNKQEHD